MNRKLILQLSLFGVAMAVGTVFFILHVGDILSVTNRP